MDRFWIVYGSFWIVLVSFLFRFFAYIFCQGYSLIDSQKIKCLEKTILKIIGYMQLANFEPRRKCRQLNKLKTHITTPTRNFVLTSFLHPTL